MGCVRGGDAAPGVEGGSSTRVDLGEEVWRVVDSSFDVVHVLSREAKILFTNSTGQDGFGYESERLVGRSFHSLVHPNDRKTARSHLEAALAKPGRTARFRIRRRSNLSGWVEVDEEVFALSGATGGPALVVIGRQVHAHEALGVALRNLSQALNTLVAGDDAIVHARDEVSLVQDMCKAIVEEGGYRFAWVGYAEHDCERSVRRIAQWGPSGQYPETIRVSWGDARSGIGPGGLAIKTGKPAIVDDMLTDRRYALWRDQAIAYGHRSGLAVPLCVRGEVIGFLGIYSELPSAFDDRAVAQLCRLGEHLSFGIERQRDAMRLAENVKGTISDLDRQRRISDRVRRELEQAVLDIGKRINTALGATDVAADRDRYLREARQIAAKVAEATPAERLSPRLRQILDLVAQGYSNREIGMKVHLSENTIKTHLQTIFDKLSVRNRAEAAAVVSRN